MIEAYGSTCVFLPGELVTISAPELWMLMVTLFDPKATSRLSRKGSGGKSRLIPLRRASLSIVLPDLSTERRQEFAEDLQENV